MPFVPRWKPHQLSPEGRVWTLPEPTRLHLLLSGKGPQHWSKPATKRRYVTSPLCRWGEWGTDKREDLPRPTASQGSTQVSRPLAPASQPRLTVHMTSLETRTLAVHTRHTLTLCLCFTQPSRFYFFSAVSRKIFSIKQVHMKQTAKNRLSLDLVLTRNSRDRDWVKSRKQVRASSVLSTAHPELRSVLGLQLRHRNDREERTAVQML